MKTGFLILLVLGFVGVARADDKKPELTPQEEDQAVGRHADGTPAEEQTPKDEQLTIALNNLSTRPDDPKALEEAVQQIMTDPNSTDPLQAIEDHAGLAGPEFSGARQKLIEAVKEAVAEGVRSDLAKLGPEESLEQAKKLTEIARKNPSKTNSHQAEIAIAEAKQKYIAYQERGFAPGVQKYKAPEPSGIPSRMAALDRLRESLSAAPNTEAATTKKPFTMSELAGALLPITTGAAKKTAAAITAASAAAKKFDPTGKRNSEGIWTYQGGSENQKWLPVEGDPNHLITPKGDAQARWVNGQWVYTRVGGDQKVFTPLKPEEEKKIVAGLRSNYVMQAVVQASFPGSRRSESDDAVPAPSPSPTVTKAPTQTSLPGIAAGSTVVCVGDCKPRGLEHLPSAGQVEVKTDDKPTKVQFMFLPGSPDAPSQKPDLKLEITPPNGGAPTPLKAETARGVLRLLAGISPDQVQPITSEKQSPARSAPVKKAPASTTTPEGWECDGERCYPKGQGGAPGREKVGSLGPDKPTDSEKPTDSGREASQESWCCYTAGNCGPCRSLFGDSVPVGTSVVQAAGGSRTIPEGTPITIVKYQSYRESRIGVPALVRTSSDGKKTIYSGQPAVEAALGPTLTDIRAGKVRRK